MIQKKHQMRIAQMALDSPRAKIIDQEDFYAIYLFIHSFIFKYFILRKLYHCDPRCIETYQ